MKIAKFSQLGHRSNNEDSLGITDGILTVCDGMGGHNCGERASKFVVDHLVEFYERKRSLGKTDIQKQLDWMQDDMNHLLDKEPNLENMGTTFTGIIRTIDVWYAAHIGDSRIYLFRPSEGKLWHTWDHSLVGELMRTKEITVEAGRFHPLSNRISRAIMASYDGKPVAASIVRIDELKAGDILLLCSDGVVEAWGDWELVTLFSDQSLSFEQKCSRLAKQCAAKSRDNNTAIIAEIDEQDAFAYGHNQEMEWTTFAEVEADFRQWQADESEEPLDATVATPAADNTPVDSAPPVSKPVETASIGADPLPPSQSPLKNDDAQPSVQPQPPRPKGHTKGLLVLITVLILVVSAVALYVVKPFGSNGPIPYYNDTVVLSNTNGPIEPSKTEQGGGQNKNNGNSTKSGKDERGQNKATASTKSQRTTNSPKTDSTDREPDKPTSSTEPTSQSGNTHDVKTSGKPNPTQQGDGKTVDKGGDTVSSRPGSEDTPKTATQSPNQGQNPQPTVSTIGGQTITTTQSSDNKGTGTVGPSKIADEASSTDAKTTSTPKGGKQK